MADFDTLAAELKASNRDTKAFLEIVAAKFEKALPGCTRISRQWGLLGGRITQIEIRLGDLLYTVDARKAPYYSVTRQRIVHGIAVGTAHTFQGGEWLDSLIQDLSGFAQAQGLSAQALERLMIGE